MPPSGAFRLLSPAQQDGQTAQPCHGGKVVDIGGSPAVYLLPDPAVGQQEHGQQEKEGFPLPFRAGQSTRTAPGQEEQSPGEVDNPQGEQGRLEAFGQTHANQIAQVAPVLGDTDNFGVGGVGLGEEKVQKAVILPVKEVAVVRLQNEQSSQYQHCQQQGRIPGRDSSFVQWHWVTF